MKVAVFLGGGRITSALAAGLRLAGDRRRIVVYDRHPEKLRALRRESKVEIARDLRSALHDAEMVIVAVRPRSVREMLAEVSASRVGIKGLWLSLAAGIPLQNLRGWLGKPVRWGRAMPSPVCRIGRGLTPVSFAANVGKAERLRVRRFFEQVGPVLEIPERQMDAITATHSPTHGYHALATLAKSAERVGLDRKTALIAAAHALRDGIGYWDEIGLSLDELLREAATPGGIAAATMAAMDASGYAQAVARGVRAGVAQARKNAKR
ncbi:MAG TPA: NAD(P)-binding domain-containing protein [Candidatus Sulfotelmatobacter sp.]|nr:NAD(P)-binding domain-containing protein [Candidatus Sulfotelmatobacter sp.]